MSTTIAVAAFVAGGLFAVGGICAMVRLLRGPSLIDRVIALDVLLAILVGVIVVVAAVTRSSITLVAAVVVALLGFLGSAGLAKLLPRDRV
ncbi:monovalent cation/H+ antiporter complex subunit F [Nakamurella leprariae]|uniref:Cation:proton antiporter n=1 Tax=Nakamurella leprariae TaxID=2803911 RepID=A0A938YB42_9ACTN|nr:monovalent cation/H+ antiporter complex subunit F [Nakamurella leprariae]MBM9469230.1 cation:proton antiporter [Nakamurella leprariae]